MTEYDEKNWPLEAHHLFSLRPWELPFSHLMDAMDAVRSADLIAEEDRAARGIPKDFKGLCSICDRPASFGVLQLYDFDKQSYPRNPWRLAARVICEKRDKNHPNQNHASYLVHMGAGIEGPDAWHKHLLEKNWYHPSFKEDFENADRGWQWLLAQQGQRFLSSDQRVLASIKAAGRTLGKGKTKPSRNPRTIALGLRARILERDGFRCRRCGGSVTDGLRLVIDHIVPVSKGGKGDEANLQTLCDPCNAGKSNRDPLEHDKGASKE